MLLRTQQRRGGCIISKGAVYVADGLLDEVSTEAEAVTQKGAGNFWFCCLNLQDREIGN